MITLRYVAQLSAALISATEAILRAPSEEQLFHLVCEAIISGGSVIGAVSVVR